MFNKVLSLTEWIASRKSNESLWVLILVILGGVAGGDLGSCSGSGFTYPNSISKISFSISNCFQHSDIQMSNR